MYVLEKRNHRVSEAGYGARTMICAFKLPDLAEPNHPSLSKEGNTDQHLKNSADHEQIVIVGSAQLIIAN